MPPQNQFPTGQAPNLQGFSQPQIPVSPANFNLPFPGQQTGQQNNQQDIGALAGFGGPVGLALGLGSQLFDFLGQGGRRRKQERGLETAITGLQGQVGQDVLDVNKILQSTRAANAPRVKEQAKGFDKRFGFDQGASARAIIRALAEQEPQQFTNLFTQNQLQTAARDDALRNQILQLQLQKSQL